jgi:hypothetical protein
MSEGIMQKTRKEIQDHSTMKKVDPTLRCVSAAFEKETIFPGGKDFR